MKRMILLLGLILFALPCYGQFAGAEIKEVKKLFNAAGEFDRIDVIVEIRDKSVFRIVPTVPAQPAVIDAETGKIITPAQPEIPGYTELVPWVGSIKLQAYGPNGKLRSKANLLDLLKYMIKGRYQDWLQGMPKKEPQAVDVITTLGVTDIKTLPAD